MQPLAISAVALLLAGAAGCSPTPTASTARQTPQASTVSSPVASSTPSATATMTSGRTTATPTATGQAESPGESAGAKIAFYAVAKAAGLDDSAKIDELSKGICSRIKAGKPNTVGPWMKSTFGLTGDVAAKVAIAAVTSSCPEYTSLLGS